MPKILLVEDNELNRDMLSRRLERRGFNIILAVDGAEGIARAQSDAPDLILMDMSLPVLDGWEATRRLKADAQTAAIPVIALTAHALVQDEQQARDAGCDDFDTKPIELPRLLEKIQAQLARVGKVCTAEPSRRMPALNLDLSKVRHDLRGPINHIVGYAEILLEDEGLPPEFKPDLERIRSGGRQLIELISHYLDEYRLQTETLDLKRLQHDLRTPVNHILGHGEMLEEQAIERKLDRFVPDLHHILDAARTWLALMEELLLPLNEPAAQVAAEPTPVLRPAISFVTPPSVGIPYATEGGQILVADDDPSNRDILTRCLERNGYTVSVVANGLEALQRLRSQPFDLALLDILMPGLDGYQVLLKLKGDSVLCDIPVIIISGFDLGEGIARCIEAGADDYLTKPFNPVLLRARIAACLDKKRLLDQERALAIQVQEEQARSEKLLLSILPAPIAERLKQGESSIVDALEEATVLFADLAGFTQLAATLPASETVRLLDDIFSGFDRLADQHGIEKIKTIGDAWMAASGVPRPRADHIEAAAELSLELMEFIEEVAGRTKQSIRLRIGLHTGPVVAGVIGQHRFSYDLWGDTVNTASRMESHGVPGKIQVTTVIAERLAGRYSFEPRGPIPIKGLGKLNTLFLTGRITAAASTA